HAPVRGPRGGLRERRRLLRASRPRTGHRRRHRPGRVQPDGGVRSDDGGRRGEPGGADGVNRLPEALRQRNFRLLFSARAASFLGTNLAPIAVAFAVLDLTGSATYVGLSFAAWTLAQISTLLVGGVVADRLPRRLVMVASDSANFCVRATMGALLVAGHARLWELLVLQAL